jgi:hypothetical protein
VIDDHWEQLPENVSDYEHETERRDRKKDINQQLKSKKAIDQFHAQAKCDFYK